MKTIIEDMLKTIRRLQDELDDRVEFEHKLLDIISDLQETNNTYSAQITEYEKQKEYEQVYKAEQIKNKALSVDPLIKVEEE